VTPDWRVLLARADEFGSGAAGFIQTVRVHRVVAEYFVFELVGEILARFRMGQVAAELVANIGGIWRPWEFARVALNPDRWHTLVVRSTLMVRGEGKRAYVKGRGT
jgi:hypothetical protein